MEDNGCRQRRFIQLSSLILHCSFRLLRALCVSVVNLIEFTTMGFVTPALLGGAALDRAADRAASHHAARGAAAEVSGAAVCAAAADGESASAAAAALAAAGAAVRDHRAVGVCSGPADAARLGRGGQGRRAGGQRRWCSITRCGCSTSTRTSRGCEQAKELAAWLLEQLPADSPVTVVDRAGRQRGQDLDRAAAELRVERLELSAAVRPMEDALRDAARWLEDKPDYRGEIYVFTDLAAEAWPEDDACRVRQAARRDAGRERVSDRCRRARAAEPGPRRAAALRASNLRRADCCELKRS